MMNPHATWCKNFGKRYRFQIALGTASDIISLGKSCGFPQERTCLAPVANIRVGLGSGECASHLLQSAGRISQLALSPFMVVLRCFKK